MRGSLRRLLLGALTVAALRHLGVWPHGAASLRPDGIIGWGAMSFALAAVVDTDRLA